MKLTEILERLKTMEQVARDQVAVGNPANERMIKNAEALRLAQEMIENAATSALLPEVDATRPTEAAQMERIRRFANVVADGEVPTITGYIGPLTSDTAVIKLRSDVLGGALHLDDPTQPFPYPGCGCTPCRNLRCAL